MGAVFSENLHAPAIVAIQVRAISFFAPARCAAALRERCISIRPIDYICRPATADLFVCPIHAAALKARAPGKGIEASTP